MSVLNRHAVASFGVITIGSFSLKEVFKRIGTLVSELKYLIRVA